MLLIVLLAGLALSGLFLWFASLEARDERHTIFVILVVVVLVEAVLAGPSSRVQAGILRPTIAGQDFRPPDAIILAALGARILNSEGRRITGAALLWASFIALYSASTLVGMLNGFGVIAVLFQGKAAFYILGGIVIASGADYRKVYEGIGRIGVAAAVAVLGAAVVDLARLNIAFSIPGQRFNRFGVLSNDSITLLILLGLAVVVAETTRPEPRRLQIFSGLILLLSPAVGGQRANYLVLAACAFLLFALFASPSWRQRSRVTMVEVALVIAALIAFAATDLIVNNGREVVAPLEEAFTGAAEQRSAATRVSLAAQAVDRIQQRPFLGWGTGIKVIREAELVKTDEAAAHNLFLDLGMRVGSVGVLLFSAAFGVSMLTASDLWRNARSNAIASAGVIGAACLVAFFAKAMVEPAIDKFRLSVALGMGVGLIMAARLAHETEDGSESEPDDIEPYGRAAIR